MLKVAQEIQSIQEEAQKMMPKPQEQAG